MSDSEQPETTEATTGPEAGEEPAARLEELLKRPPNWDYFGEYDENGVDLSLLRYMLSLSPLERLRVIDRAARDALILMEHGRRHREAQSGRHR
jgi:hypothetical protein